MKEILKKIGVHLFIVGISKWKSDLKDLLHMEIGLKSELGFIQMTVLLPKVIHSQISKKISNTYSF